MSSCLVLIFFLFYYALDSHFKPSSGDPKVYRVCNLRRLPPFRTAHMFCAFWDGPRTCKMPTNPNKPFLHSS